MKVSLRELPKAFLAIAGVDAPVPLSIHVHGPRRFESLSTASTKYTGFLVCSTIRSGVTCTQLDPGRMDHVEVYVLSVSRAGAEHGTNIAAGEVLPTPAGVR